MSWLKPQPADDAAPPNSLRATGSLSISADDDNLHLSHPLRRQWSRNPSPSVPGYVPSYSALDGPRFRIGYYQYVGLPPGGYDSFTGSESDSVIGMPVVIRPPLIPRRAATVKGIRDAIIWVQSMPNQAWPLYNPETVRR